MIIKWQKSAYSARRAKLDQSLNTEDNTSVILTSLSLILVALFVYLCHLSGPDQNRQNEVLSSIKRQFLGAFSLGKLEPGANTQGGKELDPAFILESAGFKVETQQNNLKACAPHGAVFTADNRIRPRINQVLASLAAYSKTNGHSISALVNSSKEEIAQSLGHDPLLQGLARQGAIERSFLDLGVSEDLFTCFLSLSNGDTELVIELQG
jgi:hypothetical protein